MELVEPADHADLVADAPLRFGQPRIAAHADGSKGFHGVGIHGGDAFQEWHHAAARVVDNPHAGFACRGDHRRVVRRDKCVKNERRDNGGGSVASPEFDHIVIGTLEGAGVI